MKGSILWVPPRAPAKMAPDISLLCCPNELLLIIAESLDTKGLNSLLKTCRHLAALLTPLLRKIAIQDKEGTSALHWAAAEGHGPLAKLLLENGAAIEGRDTNGRTPLQCAVTAGHLEIVRLLLDQGAGFPVVDSRAIPALHCAAWDGNIASLQELLGDSGRDREPQSEELAPIVLMAMNPSQQQAAILLRAKISRIIESGIGMPEKTVSHDYKEAVELLQNDGSGIKKSVPREGETPLDRGLKLRRSAQEKKRKGQDMKQAKLAIEK